MKVIGTAGHIDHGKSALVYRLTGIDPDRLSEEKKRGMTIDLGFAWLTLPSGTEASIIDVPGHERFISNMLAGAIGVDVALLVVAADEGVMPQTREHLDILDLLRIEHGVVALTKVDIVDEEMRDFVTEDVRTVLSSTPLANSEIVPVSSLTGAGLEDLLLALDRAVRSTTEPSDTGLPFLPVDRVFTLVGFGTVVTGTLHGGRITSGQELQVVPGERRGRVRSIQTHGKQVDVALPGARVAANLPGIERREIKRGDVLALPGTVRSVRRADVRLDVLPDAPFALNHGAHVTVHIGAAERQATVSVLDQPTIEPGSNGWAQLRFSEPVAASRGQRFIVRLSDPARTIAGGDVVDVMPRHRRQDSTTPVRLSLLRSESLPEAVMGALTTNQSKTLKQLSTALGMKQESVESALAQLQREGEVVALGEAYVNSDAWAGIVEKATKALATHHASFPLQPGMSRGELRSRVGLPPRLWSSAQKTLVSQGVLSEHGAIVALPGHKGGTSSRSAEAERVLRVLREGGYSPPSGSELVATASTDRKLVSALAAEGRIVRAADDLYFDKDSYHSMISKALEIIDAQGEVTVASLRDALGTSRKYALAFLEHLDSERITRRVGDSRVLGSKAASCA